MYSPEKYLFLYPIKIKVSSMARFSPRSNRSRHPAT
jgi:hypothetical protein